MGEAAALRKLHQAGRLRVFGDGVGEEEDADLLADASALVDDDVVTEHVDVFDLGPGVGDEEVGPEATVGGGRVSLDEFVVLAAGVGDHHLEGWSSLWACSTQGSRG